MIDFNMLKGLKVTIMGLGLHGGGIASARFFAEAGSIVTVTDLGSEEILKGSVLKLSDLEIKFVLGEHREIDFKEADLVIKNPAVPSESKYLKLAKEVETDISIFLRLCQNEIIAVTGSKGKSTTVSAIYHVMKQKHPGTALGGNITVSPLTFLSRLNRDDTVILELSSWQLADLGDKKLLKPRISVITNIMNDHQNRYNKFDDYVRDKKLIYRNIDENDSTIFLDDTYGQEFALESKGISTIYSEIKTQTTELKNRAWLDNGEGYYCDENNVTHQLLPRDLSVKGDHFKLNMLIAGVVLFKSSFTINEIQKGLASFKGVPHRMEKFFEKEGVSYINDSAATIPEAAVAAVKSFDTPVLLITGGTDKELDFGVYKEILKIPKAIYLLEGSGTDKLIAILKEENCPWNGPYSSLKEALTHIQSICVKGDSVILSPGSTSFGMFLNEFDRGNKFKQLVLDL